MVKTRKTPTVKDQARALETDLQVVEIVLEDLQGALSKVIKALKDCSKSLEWAAEELEEE
jgi:hypothetical protein